MTGSGIFSKKNNKKNLWPMSISDITYLPPPRHIQLRSGLPQYNNTNRVKPQNITQYRIKLYGFVLLAAVSALCIYNRTTLSGWNPWQTSGLINKQRLTVSKQRRCIEKQKYNQGIRHRKQRQHKNQWIHKRYLRKLHKKHGSCKKNQG